MANLLGSGSLQYRGILNLDATTANTPLDATLRAVTDGMGTTSPLQLSTTLVGITSAINIGGTFTNTARCHVRGDGVNAIARFENSAGSDFAGFSQWTFGMDFNFSGLRLRSNTGSHSFLSALTNTASTIGIIPVYDFLQGTDSSTNGTSNFFKLTRSIAPGAGSCNFRQFIIDYTINASGAQSGTASGIFLNATETNLNSMTHRLMDLQVGGASRFRVNNNGTIFATLQTGNAGLVTGQMYKDTAANILSNSDFVVGMKA